MSLPFIEAGDCRVVVKLLLAMTIIGVWGGLMQGNRFSANMLIAMTLFFSQARMLNLHVNCNP